MPVKSFLAFAGFVIMLAATYCPLLRIFGLTSWDLYDLNKPYGIVVLLVAVVGIAGIILKQQGVAHLSAWLGLLLAVLVFVATFLKVHHAFSFIPFKGLAGFLTRKIKLKWGWFLLFGGPLMAIAGIATKKSGIVVADKK